jgi:GDP-L-fucose synthase
MINKEAKIYIAGHKGMVGSAVERVFKSAGFSNLVTKSRHELNLLNYNDVNDFFTQEKIDYVILAAARVGGIQANIAMPGEFLFENLQIQNNIIHHSYLNKVQKLFFFGSSCIYPKDSAQPMKEEYLLTGKLEPTNEGYALAKITGIKLLESYSKQYGFNSVSIMPCNLYGTNDSFHPQHAHVLSSLVRKFVEAVENNDQEVNVWGTGIARREFMHVDDAAAAALFYLENRDSSEFINVGWGEDVSIKELAELISIAAGYNGKITWDLTKPNGMLKKCMDVTNMHNSGFKPTITLIEGINKTIIEYKNIKNKKL